MSQGIKHLISCHCVLPQFRRSANPIFHKFVAFSVIDDHDLVIPKLVKCNNCGVVHRVIDICKSEFIHGREETNSIISEEDIKLMLPEKMVSILETYDVDLPTWEQAHFFIENKIWNSYLVLTVERIDEKSEGKLLRILGNSMYKIESFSRTDTVEIL
jgi:ribosomal protein L32